MARSSWRRGLAGWIAGWLIPPTTAWGLAASGGALVVALLVAYFGLLQDEPTWIRLLGTVGLVLLLVGLIGLAGRMVRFVAAEAQRRRPAGGLARQQALRISFDEWDGNHGHAFARAEGDQVVLSMDFGTFPQQEELAEISCAVGTFDQQAYVRKVAPGTALHFPADFPGVPFVRHGASYSVGWLAWDDVTIAGGTLIIE